MINEALRQNLLLRSAGLAVLQSQQRFAIAIGNQFPQEQQANGSVSQKRELQDTFRTHSLGFNLSWEADLWGSFRRQVESASATLEASVASYDDVMISLVSQVVKNFVLIRTFQERIKVANDNISLQADSLVSNTRASVFSLEVSLQ